MADMKLGLIRQYCDTSGCRLSESDKDLLVGILKDPTRFNGFVSDILEEKSHGRNYKGEWNTLELKQFKLLIGEGGLKLLEVYKLECDDGYSRGNMDWDDAFEVTGLRRILTCLREIGFR